MEISKEDSARLRELEESLWRTGTRFDRKYMDSVLSPAYFEFGRSSRVYNREEVLSAPPQEINATLPLKCFEVHPVSGDVVLVTYVSGVLVDELQIGNRSSLWLKTPAGWQLMFHQGTPVSQ